jgi:hypothetical protein
MPAFAARSHIEPLLDAAEELRRQATR